MVVGAWLPLGFPSCALPFADFKLPAPDVLGLHCWYDYVLSPMTLLCDSSNLGVGLETPDSGVYYYLTFKGEEADSCRG